MRTTTARQRQGVAILATPEHSEETDAAAGYRPIGDYAIIGNCRSAALVARDGSIDWLCLPRFDSPSVFAALLDSEGGGTFRIRPTGAYTVERRYRPDTAIVETTFQTETGVCVLRDLMPALSEAEQRTRYLAEHEVLRGVEGIEGAVQMEIHYAPRPNYAIRKPRLRARGALGIYCNVGGGGVLILRGDAELEIDAEAGIAGGQHTVHAGERAWWSLSYSSEGPAVIPALGEAADDRLERTARWWSDWTNACTIDGPYRDAVVRSAITLKLLTYAPSGAMIAAPTTSLPEGIGGGANWDYRYCWLRDASFTLRAFYGLGYTEEAAAFINWMLHATKLTWPEVDILYDVYGRNRATEQELDHLHGYAGSRPVRIGNAAEDQLQLDVYGEVADAALQFVRHGGRLDSEAVGLLRGIGDTICRRWREPDEGIWEVRGGKRQHTHSKVLCWVALNRLIELHDHHGLEVPAEVYRFELGAIRAEIDTRGFNVGLDTFTQTLNGDDVDAALLTLPLYGYIEPGHSRMRSTMVQIHRRLGEGVLLRRYLRDDANEGAFGICAFWMVECQARAGDIEGATARFERLLEYGNDVGLFAEEIDPETGAHLGNFPQAFTHIGLINAALTVREVASRPQPRVRPGARPVRR